MPTKTQTKRETVAVTEVAIKQQIGLIRNNKARKRDGEKPVLSKNWKLRGLSTRELQSIIDGETVNRDFKSGRKIALVLA